MTNQAKNLYCLSLAAIVATITLMLAVAPMNSAMAQTTAPVAKIVDCR
jgi:hypothetical protein